MVAAHLRNPAATLVAVSILTLAAGCSREPEQPESSEHLETITPLVKGSTSSSRCARSKEASGRSPPATGPT
jgi:hypothetical protein